MSPGLTSANASRPLVPSETCNISVGKGKGKGKNGVTHSKTARPRGERRSTATLTVVAHEHPQGNLPFLGEVGAERVEKFDADSTAAVHFIEPVAGEDHGGPALHGAFVA